MLALLHGSECLPNLIDWIRNHRARSTKDALVDELEGLVKHLEKRLRIFFVKSMSIDEREGCTFAEGPHIEAHVVGDVAQTNFDKGSEGCKTTQGRP